MRPFHSASFAAAATLLLGGCATTLHGMNEDIAVGPTPRDAIVQGSFARR